MCWSKEPRGWRYFASGHRVITGNTPASRNEERLPHHADAEVHEIARIVDDDGDGRSEAVGVRVRGAGAEQHDA